MGKENIDVNVANTIFINVVRVLIVLLIIGVILNSFYTVSVGFKGIHLRFGKIISVVEEGLHFKLPFVDSIILIETRTVKYEIGTESTSKDLQIVKTEMALNYKIGIDVKELYTNLGGEYQTRVIDPSIKESVKEVMAKYNAEDLITNRGLVKAGIEQSISERLKKYGLVITDVALTHLDFSQEFNVAIEQKVVAQQKALQSKYELQMVEYDSQKDVIRATAQANATITIAEGEARAFQLKKQQLTPELIQLEFLNKWNGDLPKVSGNSNLFYTLDSIVAK
jgi:regulator of protease activity HflC (stomatin/prohibitin superfamily)